MKTDAELNALFAEKVAALDDIRGPEGFTFDGPHYLAARDSMGDLRRLVPNYCSDANAVLSWLERYDVLIDGANTKIEPREQWIVSVYHENGMSEGEASTFPRAAVIALLRAKGVEV